MRLEEQTLAAYRRLLGEEHPDTLTATNNLAQMNSKQRSERQNITFGQRLRRMIGRNK